MISLRVKKLSDDKIDKVTIAFSLIFKANQPLHFNV